MEEENFEDIINQLGDEDNLGDVLISYEMCAGLAGFKSTREIEQFRHFACEGMIKFGGSFTQGLGHALACADMVNMTKILRYWKVDCKKHADLYLRFLEKQGIISKVPL
jgi:hypothetical protein